VPLAEVSGGPLESTIALLRGIFAEAAEKVPPTLLASAPALQPPASGAAEPAGDEAVDRLLAATPEDLAPIRAELMAMACAARVLRALAAGASEVCIVCQDNADYMSAWVMAVLGLVMSEDGLVAFIPWCEVSTARASMAWAVARSLRG
jgi:hypothetical protein